MSNSKCIKSVAICLLLSINGSLSTSFAQSKSGGINVGGGKGIVCRDPNDKTKIIDVELLDHWEQRVIRNRPILRISVLTFKKSFQEIIERTQHILSEQDFRRPDGSIFKAAEPIHDQLSILMPGILGLINLDGVKRFSGVKLTLTQDSFETMTPNKPGCELEQIARFNQQNSTWEIAQDLIEVITPRVRDGTFDRSDWIGFGLHESLYSILYDQTGETNSLRVRRSVGHVMSGGSFRSIESMLTKPYVKCAVDQKIQEQMVKKIAARNPHAVYPLHKAYRGTIYFTKSPDASPVVPYVRPIVESVGHVTLIDYNHQFASSTDISLTGTAPEFFKALHKPGKTYTVSMAGKPDDIEFNTKVEFTMKSGVGRLEMISATGFEQLPPPIENIRCNLVQ